MEFSGNQKARIIAVTLAALGANALDARANTKERGDVLPPTHLIDSAPMSGAENDISRLSPERQYCFRIALYDTVLGVDPRYVNGHTTRSMILRADWHGLGEGCAREVDAELEVTPTVEKNGVMRPAARSRYIEIGRETDERPVGFHYTDTQNFCVPTQSRTGKNVRGRHIGSIWRLRVSAVAEDSRDLDSNGRPDVVTQSTAGFETETLAQNPCEPKR